MPNILVMKVKQVSFSRTGGAGVVSRLLSDAQRLLGIEVSEHYFVNWGGVRETPLSDSQLTAAAVVDRHDSYGRICKGLIKYFILSCKVKVLG